MDNQQDNEINSDANQIIPEEVVPIKPKAAPKRAVVANNPIKPASVKPAKPIVEGINSARTTQDVIFVKPNLTPQEKDLVSSNFAVQPVAIKTENRLMPESVAASVNKKNHHIGRWLLIFVVLLILVAGAYGFYVWNLNKNQKPVLGNFHPSVFVPQNDYSLPTLASSTPESQAASSTLPSASTTPAAEPLLQVKINSTPTGFLNVRSLPSSSGKVVTQVHPGEIYTYTKVQSGWYQITYSGFSQGWVSGQYVTKQ